MSSSVKLIYGAMNFGPQVDESIGYEHLKYFMSLGNMEIDTAYVYNEGESEKILGRLLPRLENNTYRIATKANPRVTGRLDEKAIFMQLDESLRRLGRDYVDIFYLHFPDSETPIEKTLGACEKAFQQGKFKELGLSNFPSWMVVDIWHICKKNGWITPSVYQGRYNALSRDVEKELLPALRHLGIRFYAYNPLAGGLLTGKYLDFNSLPESGRFARLNSYRKRYWKEPFFECLRILNEICSVDAKTMSEASLRWLAFHSNIADSPESGVIIGASTMNQLKENCEAIKKGALSKQVVEAFEKVWDEVEGIGPAYFSFYSS